MPAQPNVYPAPRTFFGVGREAVGAVGTAVTPTRFPPFTKFDPDDNPHILEDKGLRGSMGMEFGATLGPTEATAQFDGPVMDDTLGDLAFNILGDYSAVGAAASPATTTTGTLAPGTTTITVTSGTGILANQWLQLDVGPLAEMVQVLSVATNTITLVATTPVRLAHASGVAITNTTGPYVHTFGLLNSGTAQPPTHTFVDYTGMTPTVGARVYSSACLDELTLTGNAEQLFVLAGKFSSFISAPAAAAPTNVPTTEQVVPSWRSVVNIGGSPATNIAQWDATIKRVLVLKWTGNGVQQPYIIARTDLSIEGKLTFVAADESPLNAYLANTQQAMSFVVDNGLAGVNQRTVTLQLSKAYYGKAKQTRSGLMGYDVDFKGIFNATDATASGGLAPCKLIVKNAVPSY